MTNITDEQIDRIEEYLKAIGFTNNRGTKNELIDHLSILIELEMRGGKGFEDAFQNILKTHYPEGLEKLKKEMVEWDSYPKFLTWQFIVTTGIVLVILMMLGLYMKLDGHFVRGRLFVFANQIASNIYLPLLLVFLLLRIRNKTLLIFGFVVLQTSNIAFLAYLQDWYAANYLIPVAFFILILFIVYLIYIIKHKQI